MGKCAYHNKLYFGPTDLNVQVKQSDEVKSNLIDRETSD